MAVSDADIRAFINSGKSEHEIYQAAKQHGVSASQLENAMGWSSGTVNNWTAQNNVAALAPAPVPTPSPAPVSYDYGYSTAPSYVAPTPAPAPSSVIYPTYTPSWSLPAPAPAVADRFSDSDVRNWITSTPRSEREIYDAAKQHGVSAAQLERTMGWSSGTVSDWADQNGVMRLNAGLSLRDQIANVEDFYLKKYGYSPQAIDNFGKGMLDAKGEFINDPARWSENKGLYDSFTYDVNRVGRDFVPNDAVFRSQASYDANTNSIRVFDKKTGQHLTTLAAGTLPNEYMNLDRLGVDPNSWKSAVSSFLSKNPANASYIQANANSYVPRFAAGSTDQYLLNQGNDLMNRAAAGVPLGTIYKQPSNKEIMDALGVDLHTAASLPSDLFLFADWEKIKASSDPMRAITASLNFLAEHPELREQRQNVLDKYNSVLHGVSAAGETSGSSVPSLGNSQGILSQGQAQSSGTSISVAPNQHSAPVSGTQIFSTIDPATETIEARVQKLLSGDNPVLRQAADRVRASFASRGLLNSSMAESAAMEAMIAKAIEIAGPDAQRYFQSRTNNVDWANKFASNAQAQEYALQNMAMQHQYNKELASMQQQWRAADKETDFTYSLRSSYLQMTSQANALYQSNVANIQNSQMSADAKASALQAAQQLRDNNIAQLNATYQAQPGWVASWSVSAA